MHGEIFVYQIKDALNVHLLFSGIIQWLWNSGPGLTSPGMKLWIVLCMRPASERQCYSVTPSLIDWVHTQNDSCEIHYPPTGCRDYRSTDMSLDGPRVLAPREQLQLPPSKLRS